MSRGEGELLTAPKPRAVSLLSVCLTVKPVGEPDALIGHVRFDERCALQARLSLPSAMTAAAKPSEQPRTESCVASGDGRCEA